MRILLFIALRNLVQARRRSALLSLAIGLVCAMLVLLQAMAQGIEDSMIEAAGLVSAGHVTVGGFWKPTPTQAAPFLIGRQELAELLEQSTPGLEAMVDRHRGWVKIISDTDSLYSSLSGLDIPNEARFLETVRLADESSYLPGGRDEAVGDPRGLARPRSLMLFEAQARRLGVTAGDPVTLVAEDPGGRANTLDATVVAVGEDMGFMTSFTVFVHRQDVLDLYDISDDTTGAFWLYLEHIDDAPDVMRHLRGVLAAEGYELMEHQAAPYFMKFDVVGGEDWSGQKLDLTTWDDEVSFVTWILTGFRTITWFLVLVLVAIVAVGIMNTMWTSVRDRTAEIGTMRAIGMRRGRVLVMILLEALLLGFFATSLGAGLGALLAWGINAAQLPVGVEAVQAILLADTLRLSVEPSVIGRAVLLLTAFTGLAALIPARRAARRKPNTPNQHGE